MKRVILLVVLVSLFLVLETNASTGEDKFSTQAKMCSQVIPKMVNEQKKLTKDEKDFLNDYLVEDCIKKVLIRSTKKNRARHDSV